VPEVALTRRETQVLKLLLEGKADKEIAVFLNLSIRTVKFHVSNILAKRGVSTRAELLANELRGRGNIAR